MQKDIDVKYSDMLINSLFSMVKDVINWREVQRYVPNSLILYSDKKKCQILLALADATSIMGRKFNVDDEAQYDITEKFLDNFRVTRSLKYMKMYRKHYVLDPFNMYPNFDEILKNVKYSFDDALVSVNMGSMTMVAEMANELCEQTRGFTEMANKVEMDEQDKIEHMVLSSVICNNLSELADRQQCNFMRCASVLVGTLFDLQLLETVTFEEEYWKFQKKIDDFDLIRLKKRFGEVMSVAVGELAGICNIPNEIEVKLNKDIMKNIKTHKLRIVNEDYGFELDFHLAYEDPIIIDV